MNPFLRIFHSHANPRTSAFRNHRHTAFEISLIFSGSGNYTVENRNFPIAPGDIFLYHTNEAHCITDIDSPDGMELINIQFEPRYFWMTPDEADYLQIIPERSQRHENRIPAGSALNAAIRELILRIDLESREMKIGYEKMIRAELLSILILLFRCESDPPLPQKLISYDKEQLRQINASMDYICNHYQEDLTLDRLARQAKFSKTYYCTVFRKLNGFTPWDYLLIKRTEAAMKLLRGEKSTILNVAVSCGFNNTTHFNKIFKKVTGLTPKEYRRSKTAQT